MKEITPINKVNGIVHREYNGSANIKINVNNTLDPNNHLFKCFIIIDE